MAKASDPTQFDRQSAERIADAVRWVEGRRTSTPARRRRTQFVSDEVAVATGVFVAEIVKTGPPPDNAIDFDDERYYVRELALPAPGESWNEATHLENGRWVVAHNLEELGGTLHAIWRTIVGVVEPTSKRYAVVHEFDAGGELRYVFAAYPGQRVEAKAFIVDCCDDETGCPQGEWVLANGPAFVEDADCGVCA